ncbi:extensin-like [Zingiber officinale]|uniref:extensin-like n=1 Tax=Zingiber officinale TaxID=94328 RepID=UPI001C4AB6DA|nr:extensin-like [Zingiber officinale]
MKRHTRVPTSRRGARRPRKRALETLVTESPERSAGIEPDGQGQTPHGTAGASASQIQTVPSLEVPTLTVPIGPTPTVFTVPPTVYPASSPAVPPVAYPAHPPTVLATAYPTPTPTVPVAPYPVPPPTISPVAPTYILPAVPPAVPTPFYAVAPGVPSPAYTVVPPLVSTPVIPSVPVAIPTHPTDMIATRAQIPALAESVKS